MSSAVVLFIYLGTDNFLYRIGRTYPFGDTGRSEVEDGKFITGCKSVV